jgi:hypothetical protein
MGGVHWIEFFKILTSAENQKINENSIRDFMREYRDWNINDVNNFIKKRETLEILKTKPSMIIALYRVIESLEIKLD